jgi:hypothetical protein
MPANVVQDSDGANQSDMIHNPTLPGLCLIRHKLESLPRSFKTSRCANSIKDLSGERFEHTIRGRFVHLIQRF